MQPDVVGPKGVFEEAVSKMMAADNSLTEDVTEMLVAVCMLPMNSRQKKKLVKALHFVDDIQKDTAKLYDDIYDYYLDLYPAWRMYILCEDREQQEDLFEEYKTLLVEFKKSKNKLLENMGVLVALQDALLPSNVYADPNNRIPSEVDIADILENIDRLRLS